MLKAKATSLNILYTLTGFPILFLFFFRRNEHLEQYPANYVWFGLFAILMITRILIRKEKYETGTVKASQKTVVLALVTLLILGTFLYQFIS